MPTQVLRAFFFSIFSFILFMGGPTIAGTKEKASANWREIEKRLKQKKFNSRFIAALKKNYSFTSKDEILRLNLVLYLKKSDYHGPQVSEEAKVEVRNFIDENMATFERVEKQSGVDRHVIAGLLWMESRFGRNQGTFHVPSVFCNLLLAETEANRKALYVAAEEYAEVDDQLRSEIKKRTVKKAKWAVAELKAIEKIFNSKKMKLKEWKGSYSGAFGVPQFLPSSYLAYAKAFNKRKSPNLFLKEDAIQSVANYLKKSGWSKSDSESQVQALYKYNNSTDYGRAILNLSEMVRIPASTDVYKVQDNR